MTGSAWQVFQQKIDGLRETKIYAIRDTVLLPEGTRFHRNEIEQVEQIANWCCERLGLTYFGIDLLWDNGGPLVLDVNDMPTFRLAPHAINLIAADLLRPKPFKRNRAVEEEAKFPS